MEYCMSKRSQALLGIFLLVLLWFGLNIGLLFFNDLLVSDHHRSWFSNSEKSYPLMRILQPFISGVYILYLWAKTESAENTRLAWLGFAMIVFLTLIYTLSTSTTPKSMDKSTIICDNNGENCRPFPPP